MTSGGILSMDPLVKPWGRRNLPASFPSLGDQPIGEVWFERPPPLAQTLAKYLFTEDRLSVQVHPTASNSPTGVGKDECWLVTNAQPGARLAVGFREDVDAEAVRTGALDGSVMSMLLWIEVRPNDFIYVPAGTVHSMGAGLTLIEIQQNTDITHRLYDFGRDRPLHLDEAMASIICEPHSPKLRRHINPSVECVLHASPHFFLAQCVGAPSPDLLGRLSGAVQILPLAGSCTIDGVAVLPGTSGWATRINCIDFSANQRCLLVANPLHPDQKSPATGF